MARKRNKFDIDESLENKFNFAQLKRSLVYVKTYYREMITAFLLSVLASIISLFGPRLIQYAIDKTVPAGNKGQLILIVGTFFGISLISIIFTRIRNIIMTTAGQNIVHDIRKDLFVHLQALPFTYYDSRPHGKILVRVVEYVNSVADTLSNGIINFVLEILNLVFIAVFMFNTHAGLALVVIAGLPFLTAVIFALKPIQRRVTINMNNKSSNTTAYICENIDGVKVTQLFNRQKHNLHVCEDLAKQHRKAWMDYIYVGNIVSFSSQLLPKVVIAAMYFFGVSVFAKNDATITVGVLISMGTYASRFWQPIINIANIYNAMLSSISYLERIFQTLDEPVDVHDKEGAYELPPIKGDVEFKNVCFEYEEGVRVLDDVSFSVKQGQSVAFVGHTGSGKSTIVNLLSRFYNITSGEVLIDGHNIDDVTLHSLRSQMGVMMQDSFIFSGTVADNIRYGRLDATTDDIIAAAKRVQADSFISAMESGYNTQVSERGGRLSQGQKQLISFSRTLISDPKILILDEATSSIDARTEQLLQNGIKELLKGRTSFIIAHRLSTIQSCDIIMVVEHGKIVERGNHAELMEKRGAYYQLIVAQTAEEE